MWLSFVQVHCYSSAKLCLQVICESFFWGSDIIHIMYIYRKFHNFVVGPYAQCRELFVFLYYTHIYIHEYATHMHIHVLCINSWHEGAALSQLSQFHRLMGDAFHLQCVKPRFFWTSAALVQDVSFASLARSSDSKAHHGSRWCTYCTRDHCISSAQQLQDWQCTRLLKEEHDKYTGIALAFGWISVTSSYFIKFWLKKMLLAV